MYCSASAISGKSSSARTGASRASTLAAVDHRMDRIPPIPAEASPSPDVRDKPGQIAIEQDQLREDGEKPKIAALGEKLCGAGVLGGEIDIRPGLILADEIEVRGRQHPSTLAMKFR